jgi:hypothetical protein
VKLATRIARLVQAGTAGERDAVLVEMEECTPGEVAQVLEHLKGQNGLLAPSSQPDQFFSFLLAFLHLLGRDSLRHPPWDSYMLRHIGSLDLQINESLAPLLKVGHSETLQRLASF